MKSLDQIETRTPISYAPFIITTPGSYYLTTNLTVRLGDLIDINANEVTLDLNGFTLASTTAKASGYAINITGRTNITILNGHIRGGVTNNNGTFSGSGFDGGIYASSPSYNLHVSHVTVSGCLDYGINLGTFNSSAIEDCSAQNIGSYALEADTVTHSTALSFGTHGITACTVSDSYANGNGYAIWANNCVNNSTGISSTDWGINGGCVNNCYATSSSSTALIGITVINSVGQANGSGDGLDADEVMNCEGSSYKGNGIIANNMACNSCGSSSSGTGLIAFIANGCYGSSTSGTGETVTHKYNMP